MLPIHPVGDVGSAPTSHHVWLLQPIGQPIPRICHPECHFDRVLMLPYTLDMRHTPRFPLRRFVITVLAAVALASCGGGNDDATVGTVPPATVTPTTVATTTTSTTTTTTTTIVADFVGAPAFDSSSSVSTVGIDALFFGMTLNQARNAVEADFTPVSEPVDPVCDVYFPTGGPAGVILTVTAGTVERVDITNVDLTTRSGAGVGTTEQGLFDLFGDRLTSVAREGGGNTITFTPADASDAEFRVIFETNGTMVTTFRSGRLPQVMPTNPCG